MAKIYTADELKLMLLEEVNKVLKLDKSFTLADADVAYDEACRECGFSLPSDSTDASSDTMNQWLIQRMRRYFMYQLRNKHLLLIDNSDIKVGGIVERMTKILAEMDDKFAAARMDAMTSGLFVNASDVYGLDSVVVSSGFIEDRVGQDKASYL